MKSLFLFVICALFFVDIKAQEVRCVREFSSNENSAVVFPFVECYNGASQINKHFIDYLCKVFHVKENSELDRILEEAIFKGLDSLTYMVLETDSTISFALTVSLTKGNMKTAWVDFFTFHKTSGKRMDLHELFPEVKFPDLYNALATFKDENLTNLSLNLREYYQENKITKEDYLYLSFYLGRALYTLPYLRNDFLITEKSIFMKNGIVYPEILKTMVPMYMIVDINELLYMAKNTKFK